MKMFVLVVLVVCNPNELCVVHPLASVTDTPVGSWLLVVSRGCTVKEPMGLPHTSQLILFFFVHLVAMPKVETTEKYEKHSFF
jgi:hypothetical protein